MFHFSDNKIGNAGATSLCDALMVNTTLASLNFKGSKHIENKYLCILSSWNTCAYILTENSLDESCSKVFGDMLKKNTSLTHLELEGQQTYKFEISTRMDTLVEPQRISLIGMENMFLVKHSEQVHLLHTWLLAVREFEFHVRMKRKQSSGFG